MIVGIGTDLIQIERIRGVLQRQGERFARRILKPREYQIFTSRYDQVAFLAKRFAAKEALSKALQTGIGRISWQDVEITNCPAGAPAIQVFGKAQDLLVAQGGRNILLSLSDERDYALAFVVIST
mgnify:CR=1 FL=1|tara:strand:- start:5042 stop:5416 length:375 start_codon:yes stop_codon:yes gene_type:complete